MTYTTEFQQILQAHFDADDIPCDDFTAIRDAYEGQTGLSPAAVRASIAAVIDEEETGPLPEVLISAIHAWLTARVPVPGKKTAKKTANTGKKTAVSPPPVVEPAVLPVKPMNNVARFSQMVSYICNPGAYEAAMTPLLNTPVQLLDGFKRDSPLFAMIETTDLLSLIGTTVAIRALTTAIKSKIPKPAVVTVAAIVRWYLSTETREGLTTAFVKLALPIPVKVRSAKPSKRRAKSPAGVVDPTDASVPKRAKRVKRDPSERRPAKGYSLFTQRIGGVMKGAASEYGANVVTISDNFSEATRAKPVGGYQKYTSLLASGTLKAGESYTIEKLCAQTREEKSPVVSVSGMIWGMCDATTRLRLGGVSLPPSPPS